MPQPFSNTFEHLIDSDSGSYSSYRLASETSSLQIGANPSDSIRAGDLSPTSLNMYLVFSFASVTIPVTTHVLEQLVLFLEVSDVGGNSDVILGFRKENSPALIRSPYDDGDNPESWPENHEITVPMLSMGSNRIDITELMLDLLADTSWASGNNIVFYLRMATPAAGNFIEFTRGKGYSNLVPTVSMVSVFSDYVEADHQQAQLKDGYDLMHYIPMSAVDFADRTRIRSVGIRPDYGQTEIQERTQTVGGVNSQIASLTDGPANSYSLILEPAGGGPDISELTTGTDTLSEIIFGTPVDAPSEDQYVLNTATTSLLTYSSWFYDSTKGTEIDTRLDYHATDRLEFWVSTAPKSGDPSIREITFNIDITNSPSTAAITYEIAELSDGDQLIFGIYYDHVRFTWNFFYWSEAEGWTSHTLELPESVQTGEGILFGYWFKEQPLQGQFALTFSDPPLFSDVLEALRKTRFRWNMNQKVLPPEFRKEAVVNITQDFYQTVSTDKDVMSFHNADRNDLSFGGGTYALEGVFGFDIRNLPVGYGFHGATVLGYPTEDESRLVQFVAESPSGVKTKHYFIWNVGDGGDLIMLGAVSGRFPKVINRV